jgi:hypothetical protein
MTAEKIIDHRNRIIARFRLYFLESKNSCYPSLELHFRLLIAYLLNPLANRIEGQQTYP